MDQIIPTSQMIIDRTLELLASREANGFKPEVTCKCVQWAIICNETNYNRSFTSFGNIKEVLDTNFRAHYDGKDIRYTI